MMNEKETSERYAEIVESLEKVRDEEVKRHVIDLMEDGFAHLDLDSLGKL